MAIFATVGSASPEEWAELAALLGPGEVVGLCGTAVPTPVGELVEHFRMAGHQMWCPAPVKAPAPAVGIDVLELTEDDWPEMVDLVALTEPGPFRPRTPVLGRYVGVRDGGALVAMAGERMRPAGATEISAVCTHPSARRCGLAALLTAEVARGIQARGEVAFLHVAVTNPGARRVYESLGFELRTDVEFVGVGHP